jgi:hypothetical protein
MVASIKEFLMRYRDELFLAIVIILVAALSFGVGRLSVLYGTEPQFSILSPEDMAEREGGLEDYGGQFVGSKSGSAYHFPWCPGALSMKDENKIYFSSREEAESKGYLPAGNCTGL